jgi:hypothetical protein
LDIADKGGVNPLKRSWPDVDEHVLSSPVSQDDRTEQAVTDTQRQIWRCKNYPLIYESVVVRQVG